MGTETPTRLDGLEPGRVLEKRKRTWDSRRKTRGKLIEKLADVTRDG